jgi:ABC-2 type transport system ATP-binding protein
MYLKGKNMNVVQLENISKSFNQSLFKKKEILTDINLNIQKGEFVVLKGSNGSGKTTLLNLILGLLAPTQGEVKLFGENPKSFHSKTRLGVVLQKVSLPKNLTVKELVNLLRSYYPNPLSTEEILSTVNLKSKENNWASKLSGGEEQRLFFALALAGNPELLILDEPTRNLDEEGFIEFWEQIKICREKNITILMVTNNQADFTYLDNLVTKYVILKEGKLEENIIKTVLEDENESSKFKETNKKINYTYLLLKQTYAELLQLVRTPLYLLGIFLFPSLIVFFPMNQNSAKVMLMFFSGLMLLILAIERLGKRIALERVEGWLKLLKVTPLPPSVFFRAKIIITLLLSTIILSLMFVFGAFKLGINEYLISWLAMFLCLLLGIIPFAIFGLAMGYLFNPKSLDSIVGLSVPVAVLTCGLPISKAKWFSDVIDFSPVYHYGQLVLYSANIKNDNNIILHLVFLGIFSLIFYLVSIWAYKKDQSLN